MNRQRYFRLAKEGSWIVAGQIAAMAGALVMVRVLTEYLNPAEYGQLSLGLTVAGLINQVVMGGVTAGIGRYYSIAAEKNDLWGYLRASKYLMGLATLAVVGIAALLMSVLAGLGQREWLGLAGAALVYSVLSGYNSALSGIQNAARQRQIVALHGGMDAWLKTGLAVGVILWLGNSSVSVIIGYALSALIITVSQLFFLGRLIRSRSSTNQLQQNENWAAQMWNFSWPFSAWGIFTWAQQASDRWALEFFTSTNEVGNYAVLYQIGFIPISIASGLLVSLITPIMYQRAGDATEHARVETVYKVTWNISIIILIVTVLAAIAAYFLHELVFRLLTNERYHAISYLMPWLVVASGLQSCHHILGVRISVTMKVRSIVVPQIISAVIFVALNFLGAFAGGVKGLVYGFVAASFVYFLWMLILSEIMLRDSITKRASV